MLTAFFLKVKQFILSALRETIRERRPESICQFYTKNVFPRLPTDQTWLRATFFPFPKLKSMLKERRFDIIDDNKFVEGFLRLPWEVETPLKKVCK